MESESRGGQQRRFKQRSILAYYYIPIDIIPNIISRPPVKSVLRSTCVSKTWCSIIQHPSFADIHFTNARSTTGNYIAFPQPFRNDLSFIEKFFIQERGNNIPVDLPREYRSCPYVVGCSNGLVCLSSYGTTDCNLYKDLYMFICNPATQEFIKLPDSPILTFLIKYRPYIDDCYLDNGVWVHNASLGFGFHPSTKEFKVVQILSHEDRRSIYNNVELYTLNSNSWKAIISPYVVKANSIGVFFKQSIHWFSYSEIVSFNMGDDTFEIISIPETIKASTKVQLSLLGGCICLSDSTHRDTHDIWVMKKYNVSESWIKQFVITKPLMNGYYVYHIQFLSFRRNGDLVLLCDSEFLASYNYEDGTWTTKLYEDEFPNLSKSTYPKVFPYVGNFISPRRLSRVEDNNL